MTGKVQTIPLLGSAIATGAISTSGAAGAIRTSGKA
jgi:hypothetical protein